MSDEFKDNSEEYKSLLAQAIRRGLRAIGMTAETYALSGETADTSSYKANIGKNGEPPKTGEYRGTLGKIEDNYVAIGSNVEYFPFIEEGARGRQALHVLRKAATDHKDEYKQLLTDSIKNA